MTRVHAPGGCLGHFPFWVHGGAAFGIHERHASHFKTFCRLKSRISDDRRLGRSAARPIFSAHAPDSTALLDVIRNKERVLFLIWGPAPRPPGFLRHGSYRPMKLKRGVKARALRPVLIVSMSSPGYSSARLRPRRAGLHFTRYAHLTNGPIQFRSSSRSDTTFLLLPRRERPRS